MLAHKIVVCKVDGKTRKRSVSAPLYLHLIALRRKSGISANVIHLYNDSCIKTFLMVHLLNTCSHDVSERGECRCFYVDFFFFLDQFHECLWFACSTFYCKCVMQRGTQAGLGLGLVLIHSGLDLFSV